MITPEYLMKAQNSIDSCLETASYAQITHFYRLLEKEGVIGISFETNDNTPVIINILSDLSYTHYWDGHSGEGVEPPFDSAVDLNISWTKFIDFFKSAADEKFSISETQIIVPMDHRLVQDLKQKMVMMTL